MMKELTGPLQGTADERLADVVDRLVGHLHNDPDFSFQAAAYRHGDLVLDVWDGPHLGQDSMIVPFSVTKGTIGMAVGLLLERGLLDLDQTVGHYWPEFGSRGKEHVTVRMLLSHQAGLPQASPPLEWDELLDHHAAAERLANTSPFWYPGSAFGYHAVTIGNLASELVYRITGRTLNDFYELQIRRPYDIDFYLGLPPDLDSRRVPVLPMIRPLADSDPSFASVLTPLVFGPPPSGRSVDLGNDEVSFRFGHPVASGVGSARGIARLYAAATTGIDGKPASSALPPSSRWDSSRCAATTRCSVSRTGLTASSFRSPAHRWPGAVLAPSATTERWAASAASTRTPASRSATPSRARRGLAERTRGHSPWPASSTR